MIHQFSFEEVVPNLSFDITLEPDKQVYCFIGKNGVGKTKMLETLAKSVLYAHTMFESMHPSGKFQGLFSQVEVNEALKDKILSLPTDIKINGKSLKSFTRRWSNIRFREIFANRERYDGVYRCSVPFLFIGAKGRGYLQNFDKDTTPAKDLFPGSQIERFVKSFLRSFDCINGIETSSTDVSLWITQRVLLNARMTLSSSLEDEVITLLKLLNILEPSWNLIETVQNTDSKEDEHHIGVWYDQINGKVMINNVPVDALSTGYSSILRLFQEIISGYGAWTNEKDLSQVEGIIFIDEIESHLHAEWQSRIIPLLKKSFPNTTFYIATHSPIILATTDRDEAYELFKNEESGIVNARKLGNPRAWYLADMLETAFHIDIDSVRNGSAADVGVALRNFSTKVFST